MRKEPKSLDQCPHHEDDAGSAQSAGVYKRGAIPHLSVRAALCGEVWMSWHRLPEFQKDLQREFPPGASEWDESASRRSFLKMVSVSAAIAGLSGCTKPTTQKIVPYVRQPEELIPGKPMYFAHDDLRGYARGILVESHEGRPTKSREILFTPPASAPPTRSGRARCWILRSGSLAGRELCRRSQQLEHFHPRHRRRPRRSEARRRPGNSPAHRHDYFTDARRAADAFVKAYPDVNCINTNRSTPTIRSSACSRRLGSSFCRSITSTKPR